MNICREERKTGFITNFEKVKKFINREDVVLCDCSISSTTLDNLTTTEEAVKGKFNTGMSEILVEMGFKTPFMRIEEFEFTQLFDQDNQFYIVGYFNDEVNTTLYINGKFTSEISTKDISILLLEELLPDEEKEDIDCIIV